MQLSLHLLGSFRLASDALLQNILHALRLAVRALQPVLELFYMACE